MEKSGITIEVAETTSEEISFILKVKKTSLEDFEDFLDPELLKDFIIEEMKRHSRIVEKRRESPHHYLNRHD